MNERDALIARFLDKAGWGRATRRPLAGDASFRHYDRLTLDGTTAVLMDAPPPKEDVRPFLGIARHLTRLGYSAPAIMSADETLGLVLLEDLGDNLYTRVLAGPDRAELETTLYAAAIDLLADLHSRPAPNDLARYDEPRLLAEMELFLDWYVPRRFERTVEAVDREAYHAVWRAVLPLAWQAPAALALRDYHTDNLIWLPSNRQKTGDPTGLRRVGLLDFQDAVIAPAPYDLVSLLEDARRDVPTPIAEAMIARYLAARPELDEKSFRTAYAVLGAQRNVRILGIFSRLSMRDDKARYLAFLPRVWRLVEHDLAHPSLARVREWFARAVPPTEREQDT